MSRAAIRCERIYFRLEPTFEAVQSVDWTCIWVHPYVPWLRVLLACSGVGTGGALLSKHGALLGKQRKPLCIGPLAETIKLSLPPCCCQCIEYAVILLEWVKSYRILSAAPVQTRRQQLRGDSAWPRAHSGANWPPRSGRADRRCRLWFGRRGHHAYHNLTSALESSSREPVLA